MLSKEEIEGRKILVMKSSKIYMSLSLSFTYQLSETKRKNQDQCILFWIRELLVFMEVWDILQRLQKKKKRKEEKNYVMERSGSS